MFVQVVDGMTCPVRMLAVAKVIAFAPAETCRSEAGKNIGQFRKCLEGFIDRVCKDLVVNALRLKMLDCFIGCLNTFYKMQSIR